MPTRITEGSGTSAQITGLLASTRPTAEEELTAIDELLDDNTLLDIFTLELVVANDELLEELLKALLDERVDEAGIDDVDVPQGAPLITGISAAAVPLVPWKPNSTVWFGWIFPFQLKWLAVYGLAPDTFAFQLLLTRLSLA